MTHTPTTSTSGLNAPLIEETKFCEDCRFCRFTDSGMVYARCSHPNAAPTNTGDRFVAREFAKPGFCAGQRMNMNACSTEAKWFEAKPAVVVAA